MFIADRIRWLAMRVGWRPAAVLALILLWLTSASQSAKRHSSPAPPAATQMERHSTDAQPVAGPRGPTADAKDTPLGQYADIVRAHGPDDPHLLLLTFPFPNAEEGIRCVDAVDGSLKWQRASAGEGRYTCIKVGETTLAECSGYPEVNTLAVRRLSDGRILGRPWTLGRLYDFAISGRRVAAVEPVVVQRGREIAVTYLGDWPQGRSVIRLRVYDEWGHVLSSRHVPDTVRLTGFPRGFAVVSDARTTLLTSTGRPVAALR